MKKALMLALSVLALVLAATAAAYPNTITLDHPPVGLQGSTYSLSTDSQAVLSWSTTYSQVELVGFCQANTSSGFTTYLSFDRLEPGAGSDAISFAPLTDPAVSVHAPFACEARLFSTKGKKQPLALATWNVYS